MALAATSIGQVQPGGSDTACAAFFNPGNANFATDGAISSATSTAPVLTSASYPWVAGDVGAWIFLKSGTNLIPGWYQIASVSAGAATLTATIGSAMLYSGVGSSTISGASTVAGCGTSASLTSITWGVDYSQQNAAQFAFTDMIIGATTTQFTSALKPVGKNMIGNHIKVTSGTGFTVQTVEVVSTSTITATCDKSLGTTASTGGNGSLGGAHASFGLTASLVVSGMIVFIKSGTTYSITSASTNVTGGCFAPAQCRVVGYTTNRYWGNTDTKPILQTAVNSATVCASNTAAYHNIDFDGNTGGSFTGSKHTANADYFSRCVIRNYNTATSGVSSYTYCSFTGNTAAICIGPAEYCEAYANTATPIVPGAASNITINRCLSYGNTGGSTDGFGHNSSVSMLSCVAYGNGRDGFNSGTATTARTINCISEANGRYGYTIPGQTSFRDTCAAYNNTSGRTADSTYNDRNPINGSGSFFTNAASNDFTLNNTAGAGALLRAAAFPSGWMNAVGANYEDLGVNQHQDSGSSGMFFRRGLEGL